MFSKQWRRAVFAPIFNIPLHIGALLELIHELSPELRLKSHHHTVKVP